MKKLSALLLAALTYSLCTSAQNKIPIDDAAKHYGETVTICDKVYGAKFLEGSKSQPTLINLGGTSPNQKVTIYIAVENRKNFKDKPEELYNNKNICVTGKLIEFKGKPEIMVTKPDEIQIEAAGSSSDVRIKDFLPFE